MCVIRRKNGRPNVWRPREGSLHLGNEGVSEKTSQIFLPSLSAEYVAAFSRRTEAPEVRCDTTHTHTHTHTQGRRRRGGWGGSGRPSFSLLSASAHARKISLAVALIMWYQRRAIELLCSSVVAKSEEYAVSGIVRQLNIELRVTGKYYTLERPPTKIAVSARYLFVISLKSNNQSA